MDLLSNSKISDVIKNDLGLLIPLSNNKWIESFCPMCDDKNRKLNPTRGHLHISRFSGYVKCFRCDYKSNINDLLGYLGYNNLKVDINTKIIFNNEQEFNSTVPQLKNDDVDLLNYYFKRTGTFETFRYNINLNSEIKSIQFYNSENKLTVERKINSKIRYLKHGGYYFFQPLKIYDTIILAEGPFDIINIFNYAGHNQTDSFFVSINGNKYYSCANYFKNLFFLKNMKYIIYLDADINSDIIKKQMNNLNINYELRKTLHGKDFSDFSSFYTL